MSHRDKISHNLFRFLEEERLARRDENDYDWYQFESNTALLYMAVLAQNIADGDVNSTIPGTDLPVYERLIFKAAQDAESVSGLSTKYSNTIPVPREDVPLSAILEFKHRRRDQLISFRKNLDEFQADLQKCQSETDVRHVVVSFSEKVEKGLFDLEEVLSDSRIATVAGSMKTIIQLKSPALWATAGVVAGQASKVTDIPLSWSLAGIGILGAIEIFGYMIDRRNEKRTTLRNSPFAYLYYAQQEAIVG